MLSVDTTLASPRRYNPKWNTETGADDGVARATIGVLEPFSRSAFGRVERVDVVVPTTSLVIGNNQSRLAVLGRVNDSFGDLLVQVTTVASGVRSVFGLTHGAHDERDLGQRAIGSSVVEGLHGFTDHSLLVQRASLLSLLELLEPGVRVVVEVVGEILEDIPRHASILVVLTNGLPLERVAIDAVLTAGRLVVIDVRVSSLIGLLRSTGAVDGARNQNDTVGAGAGHDALLISVTYDPVLSESEVERNVFLLEETNRVWVLVNGPVVVCAVVPSLVVGSPAVAARVDALGLFLPIAAEIVEMPGLEVGNAALVGLLVENCDISVHVDVGVGETTNTGHGTKVVVETAVFWH